MVDPAMMKMVLLDECDGAGMGEGTAGGGKFVGKSFG